MHFPTFSPLTYITYISLTFQPTIAVPTRKTALQQFSGTISFIKTDGPQLVSLTDPEGRVWPCDKAVDLIVHDQGIKDGDGVTFTKRKETSQTAHDVQMWHEGTISFVKKDLRPHLVSLTDRDGRVWPCDNQVALIAAGIKNGDKVQFKKRVSGSQTAFEVRKRT